MRRGVTKLVNALKRASDALNGRESSWQRRRKIAFAFRGSCRIFFFAKTPPHSLLIPLATQHRPEDENGGPGSASQVGTRRTPVGWCLDRRGEEVDATWFSGEIGEHVRRIHGCTERTRKFLAKNKRGGRFFSGSSRHLLLPCFDTSGGPAPTKEKMDASALRHRLEAVVLVPVAVSRDAAEE